MGSFIETKESKRAKTNEYISKEDKRKEKEFKACAVMIGVWEKKAVCSPCCGLRGVVS